jgi:hypothetical protein
MRRVQVSLTLPPEVRRAAERLAVDERRSLSSQMAKLIADGVIAAGYLEPKQRSEAQAA